MPFLPILKIVLIIAGSAIIVGGIAGYFTYAYKYKSPRVEVEIQGTPTAPIQEMKVDIPGYTGEKIGDVTWTTGGEQLPEPFGTAIPVFKPSQVAGITRLDEPFMRSVAFITDAAAAAVSDFYKENLPKNGWAMEAKLPVVKAVYSITKFQKTSGDLAEELIVHVYNTTSTGKLIFSLTYTKKAGE